MAEQSRYDQIVSDRALAQSPRIVGGQSPGGAEFDKWIAENLLFSAELEGEIPLVKPDAQRVPLLRIGPLDFRVGLTAKIKSPFEIENTKNKFVVKPSGVELERDISFDGGLFDGFVKEVKLLSEIKWGDEGKIVERVTRPVVAKLIGIEVSFDAQVILRWLKRLSEQEVRALVASRSRRKLPRPAELTEEDKKRLFFTLAYEGLAALYSRSEAKSKALKSQYGREAGEFTLDPKSEVSLNFDPGYLLSQPERILSSEIALKTPDLSLFQLRQLFEPGFVSTGSDVRDKALQRLVLALEATLVVNLNTAAWASLGGAGAWGGVRFMGQQALSRGLSVVRTLAPSTTGLVMSGAVVGGLANAAVGLLVIDHAHFTGDSVAIGRSFAQGYARMLARAVGLDAAALAAQLRRFSDYDWRGNLAELSQMVRREGGTSLMQSAQALTLVPTCGQAAVLEEIRGLLPSGVQGFDLWPCVQEIHRAKLGSREDEREKYYLRKLYAQTESRDPPHRFGIALFDP